MRSPKFFQPAWWCRGAHTQTMVGGLFCRIPSPPLNRRRFELPDGDFLDMDFLISSYQTKKDLPLVVILHGLEGSSRSPYAQSLLHEIARRGWQGGVLHFRGCSGEPNRLPVTYHSGRTEDLDFVLTELQGKCPHSHLYVVGFSLGGNVLLKWLGEQGERALQRVACTAAVSVPYDLTACASRMDQGFMREVYTRFLLRSLKRKIRQKKALFPQAVDYRRIARANTFAVFDREATAKLNGFQDEKDYWRRSSCLPYLKSVRVPTLLIHAEDDPFFPGRLIPRKEIDKIPCFHRIFPSSGGHVGFVAGPWPWRREPWLEQTILNFFESSVLQSAGNKDSQV